MLKLALGLLMVTGMGLAQALTVDVVYRTNGYAQIRVLHVPSQEPVAAIKLRLKFKAGTVSDNLMTLDATSGPWAQIHPHVEFTPRQVTAWAIAPASGEGKDNDATPIFHFEAALQPGLSLQAAGDLIDSVIVEEAYGPHGQPLTLAKIVTTGLVPAVQAPARPVEKVRGASRTLLFSLARPQRVRAYVSDMRGRRVADILDKRLPAGLQEITWDGKAKGGRAPAGGAYLLHLEAGTFSYDRKLEVAP